MFSNDLDQSRIWQVHHDIQIEPDDIDASDAARTSAEIICWLPLTAANDFLDDDNHFPPVA